MATASEKSKKLLAEIAAKKTVKPAAKKPVSASKTVKVAPAPKKPLPDAKSVAARKMLDVVAVAPKPAVTKTPEPKAKKATEARVLYTIRLEPSLVGKLKAKGTKDGVTHAEVARSAIAAYFGA